MKGHAELVETITRQQLPRDLLFRNVQEDESVLLVQVLISHASVPLLAKPCDLGGQEFIVMLFVEPLEQRPPDPSPAIVGPQLVIGYDEHARFGLLHHHLAR